MDQSVFVDRFVGTGAAINVDCGFIPDFVRVVNLTDGDKVHENFLAKVAAFTSGSAEIQRGDTLTGATSGAVATVRKVMIVSGSWAGGDAAGFIEFEPGTFTGTFSGENVAVNHLGIGDVGNDATLSAAPDQDGIDIDTDVAATTTAATNVIEYVGASGSAARGFTIGATISESGKLLGVLAVRNGSGMTPVDV